MKIWVDKNNETMHIPEGYVLCSNSNDIITKILESENEFGYYYRHRDTIDMDEVSAKEILISEININRKIDISDFLNWMKLTSRDGYNIKYHSDDIITFNIECTMNKRWINEFCSLLSKMEYNGKIGHTEILSFMSDGDGDFRPIFNIDCLYDNVQPHKKIDGRSVYDAG